MSENKGNKDIKVKAKSFINKLSGFFKGYSESKNDKIDSIENIEASDSKTEALEYSRLETFKNTQHDIKEVFLKNMSYESENDSFRLPSKTIDKYIVSDELVKAEKSDVKLPYDAYYIQKQLADDLSKLYLDKQNLNYVKVKADTFKEQLSEQEIKSSEVIREETEIKNFPKEHKVFIGSLAGRKLINKDKLPEVIKSDEEIQTVSSSEPPKVKKKLEIKDFFIYENGSFLGFEVGKNNRKDIIKFMKPYSKERFNPDSKDSLINYEDLSVIFHFDISGILSEIEFRSNFKYTTSKGLKIGDTPDKAKEIYGEPINVINHEFIWPNLKVISNGFYITSIKTAGEKGYFVNKEEKQSKSNKKVQLSDSPISKFNIYSEGMLLGIIVENSTKSIIINANNKSFVIDFMHEFSKTIYKRNTIGNILEFHDISIKAIFDDSDILRGLEFDQGFSGQTVKGLKIGDTLEKAIELYGNPDIKREGNCRWNKLKIYFENDIIKSFKVNS